MSGPQPGILAPVPRVARYLTFTTSPGTDVRAGLAKLHDAAAGVAAGSVVVGLGSSLVSALGAEVAGLRAFPVHARAGIEVPSTPAALWFWLRGDDRGELVHQTRRIVRALGPTFHTTGAIDAFRFRDGDDLTGYEDGTENPKDDAGIEAAVLAGGGEGLEGSSFVAVQQWVHDLDVMEAMSPHDQDHVVGRSKEGNEELADAPPSAHVKRAAQESFEPTAFMVRRSMPWSDATREGLVFVAFGRSFDAFEAVLRRMVGEEDGVTDALFRFTRPTTGAHFWCPPVEGERLDLRAIGL